jgi:hypothetical protein
MPRTLILGLFASFVVFACPVAAEPAAIQPCADPACAAPSLAKPPSYSAQIARDGDFSADIAITQPCTCVRHLNLLIAFTAPGAKASREKMFKLDVVPGTSSRNLLISNADLRKAKVEPGRYTVGFALYDERDRAAGAAVSGQPFTFGSSKEALAAQPVVPRAIARDADFAVPFSFSNSGDIASRVTALVVFTRPDQKEGIEYYKKDLVVPPGGAKHVVHLSAAQRRTLKIGAGAWLVTVSAFDGAETRLASYPGNLMMIGQVLSLPGAPTVTTPIEQGQDLSVTFTLKNDGDIEDLVTGLLVFTGAGTQKPIEYKVEGIHVATGTSSHTITLTPTDRYNLGLRPGRWKVAVSALDRAGKRLPLRRGKDIVINAEASNVSAAK